MKQRKTLDLVYTGYNDKTGSYSDKVYLSKIIEVDDGYKVRFSYGKNQRWSVKTIYLLPEGSPVSYQQAVEIRDKQIAKKIKKGYTVQEYT